MGKIGDLGPHPSFRKWGNGEMGWGEVPPPPPPFRFWGQNLPPPPPQNPIWGQILPPNGFWGWGWGWGWGQTLPPNIFWGRWWGYLPPNPKPHWGPQNNIYIYICIMQLLWIVFWILYCISIIFLLLFGLKILNLELKIK